jgi:single-stranded-DNA-specific exonuclease
MSHKEIIKHLLHARGLKTTQAQQDFLQPSYENLADPFLLPDMEISCTRIAEAIQKKQKIALYGDYDIDGLSATTLLQDFFTSIHVDVLAFIPNRFDDGYGLNKTALKNLHKKGIQLLITVDCGTQSVEEVSYAHSLGLDIIITDHHMVGESLPAAVAVINPKRTDHTYPFRDFSGVGVAFQLVRALQAQKIGPKDGQEKWLLDLVALGTICDIVSLTGENRILAKWGLEVMKKTRRPGLRALLAVARIEPKDITARSVGFGLGPRLNASGRLETAQLSLDLLTCTDMQTAFQLAQRLDELNTKRRQEQQNIFEIAKEKAQARSQDNVLVLSDPAWNHGINGIVASKLMELYKKPVFVLQEIGQETKGSARSFGDFSVGEAVSAAQQYITTGGGHHAAAGVTLPTKNIDAFRTKINQFYSDLQLKNQENFLKPTADIALEDISLLDEELVELLYQLEPYGNDNPQPIFLLPRMTVTNVYIMGDSKQHIKLTLTDNNTASIQAVAFSAPEHFFVTTGDICSIWMTVSINEWRGNRAVEGRLIELLVI